MKTTTLLMAAMIALLVLSGCATRGEVSLSDANPDAYAATRGADDGVSGKDADADADADAGDSADAE